MTHEEKLRRIRRDFPYFAREFLRIRTKEGQVVPFVLNEAQRRLWKVIERQLAETGRVRLIVLKARQLGISTFSVALIYWQAMVRRDGLSVYSLAHEDSVAKGFNQMVQRFVAHAPFTVRALVKGAEHKQEWDNGSIWEYGTASTPTGGRGGTRQALHFSEIAFWKHADAHTAGSLQSLGDKPGTVAVWESTARGPAGVWYELWQAAESGLEDLTPVFLPWFLMSEYDRPQDAAAFIPSEVAPNDWLPSEAEYQAKYGLTNGQMAWRRWKIQEFTNRGMDGPLEFAMEYPGSPSEAFATSDTNSFLNPRLVQAARKRPPLHDAADHYGLEIGVDPAPSHGSASTAVIRRNGPCAHGIERWRGLEVEEVVHRLTEILLHEGPARVAVDATEFEGQHIVRQLRQVPGYGARIVAVNFGGKPDDRHRYLNKRAEIWSRLAVWLQDPSCSLPNEPATPGRPTLASELLAPERVLNDSKVVQLEAKRSMAARGVPSPDGADALACTFHRTELGGPTQSGGPTFARVHTGLESGNMARRSGVTRARSTVRFR